MATQIPTPMATPTNYIDPTLQFYEFCAVHWTQWSRWRFVRDRTVDNYPIQAGLLTIWILAFSCFSLAAMVKLTPGHRLGDPPV
jgi:hypothetical protein